MTTLSETAPAHPADRRAPQFVVRPTTTARAAATRIVDEICPPASAAAARAIRADLVIVAQATLASATVAMTGAAPEREVTARLAAIAARWAEAGRPLEPILRTLTAAAQSCLDAAPTGDDALAGERFRALVGFKHALTAAVTGGYVHELRTGAAGRPSGMQAVVSSLLAGQPDTAAAEAAGVPLASAYHVVALSIWTPRRDREAGAADARRRQARVRAELARHGKPGEVLWLLSRQGGTVLLAAGEDPHSVDVPALHALVGRLSEAAEAPITAAYVVAARARVSQAADDAHRLLDLALRLGRGPGVLGFRELACEYQLVRPGRARNHLSALLDPLDRYPDLLATLRIYLEHNNNRERAAHRLGFSVGALRYRLSRITGLTGLNPDEPGDRWYLAAAVVARAAQADAG